MERENILSLILLVIIILVLCLLYVRANEGNNKAEVGRIEDRIELEKQENYPYDIPLKA